MDTVRAIGPDMSVIPADGEEVFIKATANGERSYACVLHGVPVEDAGVAPFPVGCGFDKHLLAVSGNNRHVRANCAYRIHQLNPVRPGVNQVIPCTNSRASASPMLR